MNEPSLWSLLPRRLSSAFTDAPWLDPPGRSAGHPATRSVGPEPDATNQAAPRHVGRLRDLPRRLRLGYRSIPKSSLDPHDTEIIRALAWAIEDRQTALSGEQGL
jgi:hypothetical protein